jgi:hypothetical protein
MMMGVSVVWLDQFIEHAPLDGFKRGDAILDVGAQEFFCARDPAAINRFVEYFGGALYSRAELEDMANNGTPVRDTFLRAGLAYCAIDIISAPGVLQLDLDRDSLPAGYAGRFKFINNSGTTEHVINQLNAFKVIHDATAVGGIMYHAVPLAHHQHGMISYSPKFFWSLATANNYDILRYTGWAAEEAEPIGPEYLRQIAFIGPVVLREVWQEIWLRRTSAAPFLGFRDPAFAVG